MAEDRYNSANEMGKWMCPRSGPNLVQQYAKEGVNPADAVGVGLGVGWHGFLQGPNGFTEIPVMIRGDTLIFETSAASLGNPASFQWAVGSECDPVPSPEETNKTTLVVDYAPDNGYASWPPP